MLAVSNRKDSAEEMEREPLRLPLCICRLRTICAVQEKSPTVGPGSGMLLFADRRGEKGGKRNGKGALCGGL